MLSELHISNFALVEYQHISFGPGLNVISGETGSGKSIILQAVQCLLGEKMKSQVIRGGAESAEVQGLFALTQIPDAVRESLPDVARGEELVVARTLTRAGKSKVFLNGRLASLALLEEVIGALVDICGQNHHVRLLDSRYHLEVLDGFAQHETLVRVCSESVEAWRRAAAQLLERESEESQSQVRLQELHEIIEELGGAELKPGLRAELEGQVRVLSNAERLVATAQRLDQELGSEVGPLSMLQRTVLDVQDMMKLDGSLAPTAESFFVARDALKEFQYGLKRYLTAMEVDEQALAEKRDRLAEVARVERKYRRSDTELVKLLEDARGELAATGKAGSLGILREEVREGHARALSVAGQLHQSRVESAKRLGTLVQAGLQELAMGGSKFEASLREVPLSTHGTDQVEFMLSPNAGEGLKPLREIASGGELSRILLVLKQVLRDRTGVNVLVFDEVDSGISGAVARAVGMKLKALSRSSQVICVTHLPQVASLADQHLLVGKRVAEGRTVTEVEALSGDKKIDEIARMLSGYEVTEAGRASARELLSSNI